MSTTYGTQLVIWFLVDYHCFFSGQKTSVEQVEIGRACRIPVLGGYRDARVEALDTEGAVIAVRHSSVNKLNKKERGALKIDQPDECWKLPDGSTTEDRFDLIDAWSNELSCTIDHIMGSDTLTSIELGGALNREILAATPVIEPDDEFGLGGTNLANDAGVCRIEYASAALPHSRILQGFGLPLHPAIHSIITAG